jgi:DNA adenine methylase
MSATHDQQPERVKPIVRWPGGKSRLLQKIVPLIPKHTCYCEVFGGGIALLLAKERSRIEVINDLNGDLVTLYRQVQHHLPELLREISYVVSSRKNLREYGQQPGLTEIQRAARFLVRNKTSFNGDMISYAVGRKGGGAAMFSRKGHAELLGAAHERLDKVMVEHLSYERCMELYDARETFFFLDPPYLHAKIKNYRGWNEEEMAAFRKRVNRLKGEWIVTVDDSPFNRDLFRDCQVEAVQSHNRCVNTRKYPDKKFGELIITPK